jgi:D-sedoheptulose 7-phosphate isomerase
MDFVKQYLEEVGEIARRLDAQAILDVVRILADVRAKGGRVFVLGVGGSAANASHLVNDLRKLARLESYAPTDNVSEFSARANDEGWASVFRGWLEVSRLDPRDALFILSVGGGDAVRNVSPNLVEAIDYAKQIGARVVGIVGRDGGHTGRRADACVIVPTVRADAVTPHSEAFQSVVAHLIISHPDLKAAATKWEGMNPSCASKI